MYTILILIKKAILILKGEKESCLFHIDEACREHMLSLQGEYLKVLGFKYIYSKFLFDKE